VGQQVHGGQVSEFGNHRAGEFLDFLGRVEVTVQRGAGPREQLLAAGVAF